MEENSLKLYGNRVTPSVETVRKLPGYRSLKLARRAKVVGCSMRAAEEAEASSAGEQLAKEYSVGNSSHRWDQERLMVSPD
jgi:hypothetical protein